jgi:hypothetical protein
MTNLQTALQFLHDNAHRAGSFDDGVRCLVEYYSKKSRIPVRRAVCKFRFATDLDRLTRWFQRLLTSEPPARTINAFWFGLFTSVGSDNKEDYALYVAGSKRYRKGDVDGDWQVDPEYWPEDRYAPSSGLSALYKAIAPRPYRWKIFGEYVLCLGYGCLVAHHLCRRLDRKLILGSRKDRAVAVGFDEGDFVELGTFDATGVTKA